MIDLYSFSTPNGRKISIALEEIGATYQVFPVNIAGNEQFEPDFLKVSPNNKIPAIVDHEPPAAYGTAPYAVFESGAILLYLAEKFGKLLPAEPRARGAALQWLFWQMGGLGPMAGQAGHFRLFAPENVAYGIKRYTEEVTRLYGVADRRLSDARYFAGDDYSIADIACWPWFMSWERHGQDLGRHPNLRRWFEEVAARPAVQRGIEVP